MKKYFIFTMLLVSILASCKQTKNETMENNIVIAIDTANMDMKINPGDDFYSFVNGGWLNSHVLPADKSQYGAFNEILDENQLRIRDLVEEAQKANAKKGTITQKIGDFYATGMDTVELEKLGIMPLQSDFKLVENLKTKKEFANLLAYFSQNGISGLFSIFSDQDNLNSENVIGKFWQGGLSLPDRDYYLSNDERSIEIRAQFIEYLTKMHILVGDDENTAKNAAKIIMNIETKLANVSNSRLENRDPYRTLNHKSRTELIKLVPNFDWDTYFKSIGYPQLDTVNVAQVDFFDGMYKIINEISLDDWKVYFKWKILNSYASDLSSDFENAQFEFYGKQLSGQQEQEPRWKRILSSTQGALGMAIGQEYVKKYFSAEAKKRMLELVGNLKISLEQRISNLEWMSSETKAKAIDKLHKMNVKIGYPDKWRDYTKLEITSDSYIKNLKNARYFAFHYSMDKIGKPVDRTEWGMTPQTVNAYYNPSMNEIVFPAGILQPPFFNMDADDAVNYGAIGVVIGHEMTHGFDDQGRQYDGQGNLSNWWTDEDAEKFKTSTQKLVDQYNEFSPFDGLHVDGKLTLGENIADFGGLKVAYNAYLMSLDGKETPAPIDNFTDKQRFFIAYAQVWRNQIADNRLKRNLKEDVHSPGKYRVNGALFNVPEFYEAFPEIKSSDKLYRTDEQRAVIW